MKLILLFGYEDNDLNASDLHTRTGIDELLIGKCTDFPNTYMLGIDLVTFQRLHRITY